MVRGLFFFRAVFIEGYFYLSKTIYGRKDKCQVQEKPKI